MTGESGFDCRHEERFVSFQTGSEATNPVGTEDLPPELRGHMKQTPQLHQERNRNLTITIPSWVCHSKPQQGLKSEELLPDHNFNPSCQRMQMQSGRL
jgi:hypothetical protein